MSNSTINLTVSLVMIALFTVAILGYAFNFATDNDADINIADDAELVSLNVSTRAGMDTYRNESEKTWTSIVSSTVEPGSDVIESSGSFSITWENVFGITKNVFSTGYKKVFGSGDTFAIFITAFFSIIGFIAGLYLIKTWRGNP